jgi:hypothetical protein
MGQIVGLAGRLARLDAFGGRLKAIRTLWAVAGALLMAGLVPLAHADEAFNRRHEELLRRRDLQFTFEDPRPVEPPRAPQTNWLSDFLEAIAPAFSWVLWAALIGIGLALVWFIGREVLASRFGWRREAKDKPVIQRPADLPEPARAKALLEEADRLAETGDYELAARTLLHRSIEDIRERRPNSVQRSLTAREIEVSPNLPPASRNGFREMARAVESSWFGGRALGREQWARCRQAYTEFAFPEAWR